MSKKRDAKLQHKEQSRRQSLSSELPVDVDYDTSTRVEFKLFDTKNFEL